jgi:pre-mRNA-processing factor SLU7
LLSTGEWGYACCQSIIHASYCAGEAGIEAAQASDVQTLLTAPTPAERDRAREQQTRSLADQHLEDMSRGKGKVKDRDRDRDEPSSLAKKHLGEGDLQLDKVKLAEAIKAEREKKRKGWKADEVDEPSGKRKKYNDSFSSGNHEVTEEELGASICHTYVSRP